jgi:hypothetical protein
VGKTAWQDVAVDEIKQGLVSANRSKAMQTRLANIVQHYPAFVTSISFVAIFFFYLAASSAFA